MTPATVTLLLLECAVLILVLRKRSIIDTWFKESLPLLYRRFRYPEPSPLQLDCSFFQQLISSLRSGQGLEQSLEKIAADESFSPRLRQRSHRILRANAALSAVDELLSSAIRHGQPCLPVLQFFRATSLLRLKSERKLRALSLQCRLQAVILSVLPFFLILGFAVIDPAIFGAMAREPLCWLLWTVSSLLCIGGFLWMNRLQRRGLRPQSEETLESEEFLPDFLSDVLASVSAGNDVSFAAQIAARRKPEAKRIQSLFYDLKPGSLPHHYPENLKYAHRMLCSAAQHGAPLKDELLLFLQELQSQRENRWEEALQKLPLQLLAPLFCCFFSAAMISGLSILIPMLKGL